MVACVVVVVGAAAVVVVMVVVAGVVVVVVLVFFFTLCLLPVGRVVLVAVVLLAPPLGFLTRCGCDGLRCTLAGFLANWWLNSTFSVVLLLAWKLPAEVEEVGVWIIS